MTRRGSHRGFTLLELVLVLMIVCITLAMAAPSLRGWSKGSRLHDEVDAFVAVTRLARTQAVTTSKPHRLFIDPATATYQLRVQEGEEFIPLESGFGRPFELPQGYRIELRTTPESADSFIPFYPTGRTQPAQVRITSELGETVDIECASPAESFEIVPGGAVP
ncbi:MAG TPA: prepilin-type N-terminal cleavage/methylation domain-containing protein [Phycisphaerae bacterium]|nr:prepilin-type N-terminal cleavage/methylation domain-containing protein [Phycisphaerae bacterium]HRY68900.1 prepilin-type N-terminal cleavage/methylation domain-containing protein [Phycisphaerae bacterium]HSA25727.1 prepilin-type N-terminal cleavage/methylation domain-containing protein [Phycisphaerae bacterium]